MPSRAAIYSLAGRGNINISVFCQDALGTLELLYATAAISSTKTWRGFPGAHTQQEDTGEKYLS